MLKTIFAQDTAETARQEWTTVADAVRERFEKMALLMHASRDDSSST